MAGLARATQLLLIMLVMAAIYMSTAAAQLDGNRRTLTYQAPVEPVKTSNSYYPTGYSPPAVHYPPPPPVRVASCTKNATICLDSAYKPAGPTCCASKCVDTQTDIYNCGGCSRACFPGWSCCNSKCVNLVVDSQNCGTCGKKCPKNWSGALSPCTLGFCGYNGWGI